jgi:DnaJ-class molecular chaperone
MTQPSDEDKEIYRERIRRVQRDPGPDWGAIHWIICPDCEGTGRAQHLYLRAEDWCPACEMCQGEGGWRD